MVPSIEGAQTGSRGSHQKSAFSLNPYPQQYGCDVEPLKAAAFQLHLKEEHGMRKGGREGGGYYSSPLFISSLNRD